MAKFKLGHSKHGPHNHDASKKGHKHKHNPTWLPKKIKGKAQPALTHAYYRRHKQVPPSRLKKEEQKRISWHVGRKKKE